MCCPYTGTILPPAAGSYYVIAAKDRSVSIDITYPAFSPHHPIFKPPNLSDFQNAARTGRRR